MRKNILIFGYNYGTQFVDINNQYSKLFDKNKFEVTIVYLVGEEKEDIRKRHTAEQVVFLNSPKKSVRGLKVHAIKSMLALCREKKFDKVICHRYKPTYIMLLIARFIPIPAIIAVMHEFNTLNTVPRKILIALLAQKNILFAGVSNAVRDNLRKTLWGVPPEHIITLYNMIDIDLAVSQLLSREEARQQLGLPLDAFVFGNTGRLVPNKDQATLIQAFSMIKNQCPQAKLIILGDGALEENLRALTQTLKLENEIIFTGYVPNANRFMKAFDIFISSSTQEAFGLVLIEAMAAKIPVIATRTDGMPEVIGESGVLTEPRNPDAIALEMQKAYHLDAHSLANWGLKGYHRANDHFSQKRFNEIFWQLPLIQSKENL